MFTNQLVHSTQISMVLWPLLVRWDNNFSWSDHSGNNSHWPKKQHICPRIDQFSQNEFHGQTRNENEKLEGIV